MAALRYGAQLLPQSRAILSQRIYQFGRVPLRPETRRRFSNQRELYTFLKIPENARLAENLVPLTTSDAKDPYWRSWRRIGAHDEGMPRFKLYISPVWPSLPEVIPPLAAILARSPGVWSVKLGTNLHWLSRPDKLVVHLHRLDDLYAVARRLQEELPTVPPHPVPFARPFGDNGLISWGIDQVVARDDASAQPVSWRSWQSSRAASLLIDLHAAGYHGDKHAEQVGRRIVPAGEISNHHDSAGDDRTRKSEGGR
jgi:hypothetical protein